MRVDAAVDFDWQVDTPAGMEAPAFDVTWNGEIAATISGLYEFSVVGAGSTVLTIDGRTIIDTATIAGPVVNPIRLEAGRSYSFALISRGTPATGTTRLLWSTPGMTPQVVPPDVFLPRTGRRRLVGR